MSSKIANDLSGVVVNQNQKPGASDWTLPVGQVFQEFYLPTTYARGSDTERVVPELSGFSIMFATTSLDINVEWSLEYLIFGGGWIQVASGTETKVPHIGERVWTNIFFDDPVDVPEESLVNRWHIGLKVTSGISKVWFSRPNPLAIPHNVRATKSDGFTSLGSPDFSFLFRVLALTADGGTDFLGNTYRSAVLFDRPGNASTVDGDQDQFWLSKPNPSRFAVENLYYDMRPSRSVPSYGRKNWMQNPSFEAATLSPHSGNAGGTGGSIYDQALMTDDAFTGNTCFEFTGLAGSVTPVFLLAEQGTSRTVVATGDTVHMSAAVKLVSGSPSRFELRARTLDAADSGIVSETVIATINAPQVGVWLVLDGMYTCTDSDKHVQLVVAATDMSGSEFDIRYDSLLLEKNEIGSHAYYDGSFDGYTWTSGLYGASIEILDDPVNDNEVVIDRVLVDPLTPGIYFSIYYTSDDRDGWDDKLWTRVPQTFHAIKRENHVLPEPIRAKYIKLEFTHLQARSYSPGNFAKPITYQKHPKWVLDYFLARIEAQRQTTSALDVGSVSVRFDAYDLAYNYYLDDLGHSSNVPFEIDPRFRSVVSDYLASADDLSDRLDPIMLDKIKVALTPYRSQISSFANPDTLLGGITNASNVNSSEYPVERNTVSYADSQQLRNSAVVFENDYPVMFFYLTCRHAYRVVTTTFDNDKAYFAGIRQVAFTRENYTVAFDTDLYIEPHGDLVNTERNDFAQVEGSLVV